MSATRWDELPLHASAKLDHIFDEVEPWNDDVGLARVPDRPAIRIPLDGRHPSPWMTLFLLRDVVGCRNLGRHEKLRYEIPVRVESGLLTVTHEKFGPRAYVEASTVPDDTSAARLVDSLIRRLRVAIPIIEKHILEPVAAAQLRAGRVTVENQFHDLMAAFNHFRERAAESVELSKTIVDPSPEPFQTPNGVGWSFTNVRATHAREAWFDTTAAVIAFFSLLEHLLVLAFAFADPEQDEEDLEQFVRSDWASKYRRIVGLSDADAKKHYDELRSLADSVRNPRAHGGFDRDRSTFHFHLDNIGPVPVQLSEARNKRYSFLEGPPIDPDSVVWPVIDHVFTWASGGDLRYAWQLAQSGLDVAFDEASRVELSNAALDDQAFEEYLNRRSHLADLVANMDW